MMLISKCLRPNYNNGDSITIPTKNGKSIDAVAIYNDFTKSLLKSTKENCVSFSEKSIIFFNEHSYIKDITNSERSEACDISFVMALIKTQCFSNYIASN